MKLKSDFITQEIDDTQFLVPVGAESFSGIVRSNKTAAFIVDCLKEETTEEALVDKMCADRHAALGCLLLDTLRKINAIEE